MKRSLRGRADLLRSLTVTEDSDPALLAKAFGYGMLAQPNETQSVVSTTGDNEIQSRAETSPLLYEAKTPITLWTLSRFEILQNETVSTLPSETQVVAKILPAEPLTPELPAVGLLEAGDWQNLWDGLIPKELLSNRIDVARAVLAVSKSLPIDRLPRLPRVGASRSAVLLLDSHASLYPAWYDLKQLTVSLQKNYSSEDLQVYCLPYGPRGSWQNARGQSLNRVVIDSDSPVYLAGTFGALVPGNVIEPPWQSLMEQLLSRGNSVSCVSLVSAFEVDTPVVVIDSRPLSQHRLLLAALSQCWRPTVTKLRRLRLAIPGASLADELWVYNHDDVERVGRQLPLKAETLLIYNQQYRDYPEMVKKPIEACIAHWQANYQGETACEAECLQQALHNPPSMDKRFPRLRALSVAVDEQIQQGKVATESLFMRSISPLTEALAPQVEHDNSWEPLLQSAQQLALREGRTLPWAHRGLSSSEKTGYLKQVGDELVLDDDPSMALMAEPLGNQSYCSETNTVIDRPIKPPHASFEIIDDHRRYVVSALHTPNWAARLYRNTKGSLVAAHAEGARFELLPASAEQPQSVWRLVGGLWTWARETGIDERGLWAELDVDNAAYRLRWIPPGSFMMGSPENEQDRDDDEHLHEVTLSQGYWLGETTVTQALWQTITDSNPSEQEKDGQLPVNNITWNDCRNFINAVQKQLPSLDARFPTEAQWEYACRAGTQTRFWWGNELSEENGNMTNSSDFKIEAHYPANGFGLRSMHGNLREWCNDWYSEYPKGLITDPQGPGKGQFRVLRGGCWFDEPQDLRAAYRDHFAPDSRDRFSGLRLAGGHDPQAARRRGVAQTADRDERNEEQRGGLRHPSPGKNP